MLLWGRAKKGISIMIYISVLSKNAMPIFAGCVAKDIINNKTIEDASRGCFIVKIGRVGN
jgi:hypothetical protein